MRRNQLLLMLVLMLVALTATACAALFVPTRAEFGQEIPFASGRVVQYPDFALEYVGQHRVIPEHYPRGFLYYDFRISHGDRAQAVAWTDGTGVIEPADFTFGDGRYTLEVTDRNGLEPFTTGQIVVKRVAE